MVLNPAFPQADFERLKRQQVAAIEQESAQPIGMALRVLPRCIYGAGHAYGTPLTGSGTQATVGEDHPRGHGALAPDLVQAGQRDAGGGGRHDAGRDPAEAGGAASRPGSRGAAPKKTVAPVAAEGAGAVYLVDRPGALQSLDPRAATRPRRAPTPTRSRSR